MTDKLNAALAAASPAPTPTEPIALLRELQDCGAITNWLRVSDDLRARIGAVLAAAPPTRPESGLLTALTNLANVFHEGRARPAASGDEGYVQSVVSAAEAAIAEVTGSQP